MWEHRTLRKRALARGVRFASFAALTSLSAPPTPGNSHPARHKGWLQELEDSWDNVSSKDTLFGAALAFLFRLSKQNLSASIVRNLLS
jgi:hypothetical protein